MEQKMLPRLLPHLLDSLRSGQGTPEDRIQRALEMLAEELNIPTVFVSRFVDGQRHFSHAVGLPEAVRDSIPSPVQDTVCHLIAIGEVGPLVTDTSRHPLLSAHPHVLALGISTYVGVPLVIDGEIIGAVCGVATVGTELTERDADRWATMGAYIAEVLSEVPPHRINTTSAIDLPHVAALLVDTTSLESITRPLLELIHTLTGLESTCLTLIDWAGDQQRIVHSLNTAQLTLPEGLKVPWSDTLCKRALAGRRSLHQRCTWPVG
jgi:GAF domain-containing protein